MTGSPQKWKDQIGVVNSGRDFSFSDCFYLQMVLLCRGVGEEGALVRKDGGEYFNADKKTGEKGTQHLVICFSKLSLMM